jgi:hypothetical protein
VNYTFTFVLFLCTFVSCARLEKEKEFGNAEISKVIGEMTEAMVNDVTNPPLASRFYAYACLAGYEIISQNVKAYPSLLGKINGYPEIEKPGDVGNYSYQLASLLAMMETAAKLQPSGSIVAEYEANFIDSCLKSGISEDVIAASLSYAKTISTQILAYAKADKYNQTTTYRLYTPLEEEGKWYPTPPGYFAPVEPYFNSIRSFTLLSPDQFRPIPPVAFSSDEASHFFKMMREVYIKGSGLSKENRKIAAFWDCNPFALQDKGHLMVGMKKISPGAHWMGITGIVVQDQNLSFPEAMKVNTIVAISLMDGFIACWDEKFRSNRIRPETAIRKYIDADWKPFLQTPPFPEYLSGHSTISTAAAEVLTHYLGENIAFTDTVELPYGLEAREFESFRQAANEAAMSRLYGGIHFMDAIIKGQEQGSQLGAWIIKRVEEEKEVAER